MDKKKVLVVDDDPIILEVTRERLEGVGHEVHVRDQALGTSQWIAGNSPDVLLVDVMMPALSGAELASLLKRRGLNLVIILYSSKSMVELKTLVRETGAVGAISKSLNDTAFLRQFELLTRSGERTAERKSDSDKPGSPA
jgi:CheY-like chemotaxis protein